MSIDVLLQLLGLLTVAAVGYVAARLRLFGAPGASRVLSNAAFSIFAPALLFRATASTELQAMPRTLLLAFFVPVLLAMALIRWLGRRRTPAAAAPAVLAMTLGFGNSVQVGLPMASTLYGDEGLRLHLALVSMHALLLLGVATVWVELDLARAQVRAADTPASWRGALATLGRTLRQAIVHPVVLPVLLGFAWNLAGLPLTPFMDHTLALLGQAVVPLCLVLIGASLAEFNLRGALGPALGLSVLKLLALPLWVGWFAHQVLGLGGTPLAVVVMAAALPVGSNTLLFAQRYECLEAQSTAAVVLSTVGYLFTVPLCLMGLAWLGA
jgi:malonate transporter